MQEIRRRIGAEFVRHHEFRFQKFPWMRNRQPLAWVREDGSEISLSQVLRAYAHLHAPARVSMVISFLSRPERACAGLAAAEAARREIGLFYARLVLPEMPDERRPVFASVHSIFNCRSPFGGHPRPKKPANPLQIMSYDI